MDEKKRDLIPIAAIAVFLVIIMILCIVRLSERKRDRMEENQTTMTELTETMTMQETLTVTESEPEETQTVSEEDAGTEAALGEEETLTETETNRQSASGEESKPQTAGKGKPGVRTISGNDPFAAAEGVNKTNEEMLLEMSGYWEQDNMNAVRDLAHLAWFMKMSASIADKDTFYYYGGRNAQGQPEGVGIACYADNSYYYGSWANGKREGNGEWVKYYMYYDDDTTSDRAYILHMYMGEWANDMPNGEGHEHYELNMAKAAKKDRYLQNMIGTFQNGFYSGEMYLTTLDFSGNQEEWNGFAEEGIWSPYGAATNKKEVPICQSVENDDNYLWMTVKANKDRGIEELIP